MQSLGDAGEQHYVFMERGLVALAVEPINFSDVPVPSEDTWWRLRDDNRVVVFETAPEGSGPWTRRLESPKTTTPDRIQVFFGVLFREAVPERTGVFDCINLPTNCGAPGQ